MLPGTVVERVWQWLATPEEMLASDCQGESGQPMSINIDNANSAQSVENDPLNGCMNQVQDWDPTVDERKEWSISQLIEAQDNDPFCSNIKSWIKSKIN